MKAANCAPSVLHEGNTGENCCPLDLAAVGKKENIHPHIHPPSKRNPCTLTMGQGSLGKNLAPICLLSKRPVPVDNRVPQQAPYHEKAKLNHTCSSNLPPQVSTCRTRHTRNRSINGCQYYSQTFAAFCKCSEALTSSFPSLYPQSNGFIDQSVQTAKNLLRKAEALRQDPAANIHTVPHL